MKTSPDLSGGARLRRKLFKLSLPLRRLTAESRKSADIIIVGAQKAGTTYLFSLMAQSDGFYGPPVKEVHYFDVSYSKGSDWYRAHFERSGSANLQVDASPFYMFHPDVPARIAVQCPDAKIIAVLRDPVARAYSHYHHNLRHGREVLDFQSALAAEGARIASPDTDPDKFRHFSYVERGKYSAQIARLYAAFPKQQVHLVDGALLFVRDRNEWDALENFIGRSITATPKVGLRKNAGQYKDLDNDTVAQLKNTFASSDEELAHLTSRKWSWMAEG